MKTLDSVLSGFGDIELDTTDYDSKHINNLAPGQNIPESIIENLNKNGMTVDNIEKLQDSGLMSKGIKYKNNEYI